ncbi:nicotinate phosphoribosyltransferase [Blastococcus sp. Marseille-P5729]|uniref:nicotinate phosphoribosyltransferase n=1 Tax=Blastococcus sp. Marseille-P5729 TaxID=2086582 RepID=UPI000D0FDE49|nr:nicotinate phosphoribosyltransferase [Blastococcus sp. Marseille-P5729]
MTSTTPGPSTALLTDHYELTMIAAALKDGTANRPSVFEAFTRRLPDGRRYGVVGGTGRLIEAIERFRFDDDQLRFLRDTKVVDADTVKWLEGYRFTGDIVGYREGEIYFPESPVLTVRSTFAEAVVLETLVLSILNHDSAVASAGARMVSAAGDRPCIEMGSRRAHEQAAVAAARAAYLVGFASTSNLEAGRRFGVPTAGTAAHSWTLLHDTEDDAFASQVAALGTGTSLLVDTYDVMDGIRNAIEAGGTELGAIRLDSGDLGSLAHEARELLDSLGARRTRIIVTSDLDEYAIASLRAAPVDGYGVGTKLVTGSGAPTAGMVYKLVERDGVPVEKKASGKGSIGGAKTAVRRIDERGQMTEERAAVNGQPEYDDNDIHLQVDFVRGGEFLERDTLETSRAYHREAMASLPREALKLLRGSPVLDVDVYQPEG